jgi:hypothetical protein
MVFWVGWAFSEAREQVEDAGVDAQSKDLIIEKIADGYLEVFGLGGGSWWRIVIKGDWGERSRR